MKIPQIQALRAFAAILVVIYHAKLTTGGYIGVDIFYVISGYLITGLILREMTKSGTLNFRSFYLRRIKRLLPTSFFVLIVTAITSWYFYPTTMRADLAKDIAAAGIYISNYLFAFWQMDYQNLSAVPPVVIHYWSLAVEEQFYLLYPFLIFTLFRRGGKRLVGQGILTMTILSFLVSLYQTENSPIWAFYSLPTRAWELGVGALLLYIPQRIKFSQNYLWFALLIFIYATINFQDSTPFPGRAALLPVCATALSIAAYSSWPRALNSLGSHRTVQWLGEISYPLYLWHWPLLVIPAVYLGRGLHIYERALCILATILLAHLTHHFIENPLRKAEFAPRAVITGAVIATISTLFLSMVISSSHTDRIRLKDGTSYSLTEIKSKPEVYNDGCHVNNGETTSPDCTYGTPNAKIKVVLFGDSHAAQWFPTLEKLAIEKNFELISLTKSACPGPAVRKVESGAYKNADCSTWRANAISRIQRIHPAAVLVSGMQHYEVPTGFSSRTSWWREGMKKTLSKLQASSDHIIYISDTPHPTRDVPSCLASGSHSRCDSSQPTDAIFSNGFQRIDPTPWLCPQKCSAILDGTVVYRDSSHITVSMARKLSLQMERTLLNLGVHL